MAEVDALAQSPHPVGSAEAKRQRQRLTEQLQAMGLEVQVQRTRVQYQHPAKLSPRQRIAWVENIIASLPGTAGGQNAAGTVAVMSHYDSVWQGPGAGDAASGVAAVLAAARAATELDQRRNRLLFVLTDGEEMGLFGAQAFFRQHPLASSIDLVLNFEARGNQGPPQMFQTSPGNAGLIGIMSKALSRPVANSLSFEVYRRMPNDTDLTISIGEGIAGLNFAFIDGYPNYHSITDNPQMLSQRSLLQQAQNAVQLTTTLANADLSLANSSANLTYFNLTSALLVSYPLALVWALFGAAALAVLAGLGKALRQHVVTWQSLLAALAAMTAMGLTVNSVFDSFTELYIADAQWRDADFWRFFHLYKLNILGGTLLTLGGVLWLGRRLANGVPWGLIGGLFIALVGIGWWSGRLHLAGLTILASALLLLPARRGLAGADWLAAFALLWLIVSGALVVMLPHASYMGVILALPAGLALLLTKPRVDGNEVSAVSGLLFIPAVLVMGSMLYAVYLGLGTFMPQLPLALLAVLSAGILLPFAPPRSALSTLLVSAGISVLVTAPWQFRFDQRQPQPSGLFTLTDASASQTVWASRDDQPPAWAEAAMGRASQVPLAELIPGSTQSVWRGSTAAANALKGPLLTTTDSGPQSISLSLTEDAPSLRLYFSPADRLQSVSIDSIAVAGSVSSPLILYGAPAGTLIQIQARAQSSLQIHWQTALPGLPPGAPQRPADHMPAPGTWSDTRIWHGIIRL